MPLAEHARRAVRRTLRDRHIPIAVGDADDLVQETMLRLWERYPRLWDRYPRALVRRVAENITLDAARRSLASKRDLRRAAPADLRTSTHVRGVPIEDALIVREGFRERLLRCRSALSREAWRIFVLLYLANFTSAEAAPVLGVAPSSIDTAASRLRFTLASRGIVLRRRQGGVS